MVEHKLIELLGDPDFGLDLKEEVEKRIRRSLEAKEKGGPTTSAEEVAKKLGLSW